MRGYVAAAGLVGIVFLLLTIAAIVVIGFWWLPYIVEVWSVYFGHPIVMNNWLCLLVLFVLSYFTRSPLNLVVILGIITYFCELANIL